MIVIPHIGRKGDVVCEIDGILCLFPRKIEQPKAGREVDVMITHHPGVRRRGPGESDGPPAISFLFVQPVTTDHIMVDHEGFECSGSMCRTTAGVAREVDDRLKRLHGITIGWLTPGRSPVIEISNVNVGWSYRDERTGEVRTQKRRDPSPGRAFVSLTDLRDGRNRVCGLPDLSQVDRYVLSLLVRRGRKSEVAA